MFTFFSSNHFVISYKDCYVVDNPMKCNDFEYLINQYVSINEKVRKVLGVESFMHSPPWQEGEVISLMVE